MRSSERVTTENAIGILCFCSSGRFIFSKVDRLGRGKGRVKEKIILEFIDYSVKLLVQ